ncbi:MAG: hypothetical protein GXO65_04590 [Euryarchaeota archaeon]|nr:hypothetical protein [Euryarchaeota archaeon]
MGEGFLLEVDRPLEMEKAWKNLEGGRCIRCSRTLKLRGVPICEECADEVNTQRRRRSLLASFLFHVAVLLLVYLYFFRGLAAVSGLFG